MRRNTVQRQLVYDAVMGARDHPTCEQVYVLVRQQCPTISLGTVYRNLSLLAQEGRIRRVTVPEGADHFDFTLAEHSHIKCMRCGAVSDVKDGCFQVDEKRLASQTGYCLVNQDILFSGICPSCQKEDLAKGHDF